MIASKKRDAALGIIGGLAASMSASALELEGAVRAVWVVVGVGLYLWGAMSLAQAKGYSRWWGALALTTIVGMLVLVLIRDRSTSAVVDGWPDEAPRVRSF